LGKTCEIQFGKDKKCKLRDMKILKQIFLTIVLLCNASAFAYDFSDNSTGTELFYSITDANTVAVASKDATTPFANSYSGDVVIPQTVTYNSVLYQVTSIDNIAFVLCQGLTSVVIPEGVTTIGNSAFAYCTSLTSISIPSTIINVGDGAFEATPWLRNLPSGLLYFGDICYCYCGTIAPNSVITVKDGTAKIAYNAFYGQTNAFSVQLPESVTEIGMNAFDNSGLTGINLPSGVTVLEGRVFSGCKNLSYIDLQYITKFENYVFSGCSSLTSVDLPESVILGVNVFENSGLTTVTIPGGWESTGVWTFYNCKNLQSVVVSEGVETIGMNSFNGCELLNTISLPGTLKTIKDFAFRYCEGFTSFTIPPFVTSVGSTAFQGCNNLEEFTSPLGYIVPLFSNQHDVPTKLTKVIITAPCTEIAASAFYECNHIKEIILPEGLLSIGNHAFSECLGLLSISLPSTVESIDVSAFRGCRFTSITLPENLTSLGGGVFDGCDRLTSINIPEKVTRIPYGLFRNCKALTTVTMSDNVTDIGMHAFDNCEKLQNFTFPSKLKTIEMNAFFYCPKLPHINLPESVISVGEWAFAYCSAATTLSIPKGLESLPQDIFEHCSALTKITIPKNITHIDFRSFMYCTGLQEITVEWETPLDITEKGVFMEVETSLCVLKVPAGTKELYLADEEWSKFLIEEYEITVPTYTVTFSSEGITIAQQSIEEGNLVTRPENPQRTGFDFGGWDIDNNTFLNEWNFETDIITQDTTLYAKWNAIEIQVYTVTFAGEEITIAQQSIEEGNLVIRPENPTREGYTFGGWYIDNNTFLNEWNFETNIVTQDTILYAKWSNITGIKDIKTETEHAKVVGYYNIMGQKLPKEPASGIFIVLYDDGTVKKVIVNN
jgi:uncharacterized repeat protein (TIGR02543 family)